MSDPRTAIARVLDEHEEWGGTSDGAACDCGYALEVMADGIWTDPDVEHRAHQAAVLFDTIVKPLEDELARWRKATFEAEAAKNAAEGEERILRSRLDEAHSENRMLFRRIDSAEDRTRVLEDGITALADQWTCKRETPCGCSTCDLAADLRALLGGGPHE